MINARNLRKPTTQKEERLIVDSFQGFVNTLVSDTRLQQNEAAQADNLMQTEDGVWGTRWGTADYGTVGAWTTSNDIDGVAQFVTSAGARHLCVISNGVFYKSTNNGTTWTAVAGATFTAGSRCHFTQYGAYDNSTGTVVPYLYIVNGVDPIVRYDGTDLSEYTEIDPPANVGAAKTGLTGTTYTYYYVVEAYTSGGTTGIGTADTITVGATRDRWDSSNYVTVTWDTVANARGYLIYAGTEEGNYYYIGEVAGAGTLTFIDYGANNYPMIYDWEPGIENTTGGPVLKSICASGNRLVGVDTSAQVRWTGAGGAERGSWGIWSGGGYLGIDRGGNSTLQTVIDYQNKPHVFASYPHGRGRIYAIDESSLSVAGEEVTIFYPNKILDDTGTASIGSVIPVENDVFYWDSGVRVLGNEPGVLSVLRTNELSQRIRPTVQGVTPSAVDRIVAVYYEGKILFSVPYDGTSNDRVIVYDRERLGWIPNWSIGVSQFLVYTDTTDTPRLLGVSGAKLVEFSANYLGDSNTAFAQKYIGPRLASGKDDFTTFSKYKYLYLRFRNLRGTLNVSVVGTGKNKPFSSLAAKEVAAESSNTGLSWELLSEVQLSDSTGSPSTFTSESVIVRVPIKKRVRDIQITVSSKNLGDQWVLVGYILSSKKIRTSDPATWKA